MTDQTREEVEALVGALAELAREAVAASADGRLDIGEVAALGADVIRVGRAISDLVKPNTPKRPRR